MLGVVIDTRCHEKAREERRGEERVKSEKCEENEQVDVVVRMCETSEVRKWVVGGRRSTQVFASMHVMIRCDNANCLEISEILLRIVTCWNLRNNFVHTLSELFICQNHYGIVPAHFSLLYK